MNREPDEQTRIHRASERGSYGPDAVRAILEEGMIAHVGTVRDGHPVVIPMFYAIDGNFMMLHGAPAAGVIRRAGKGIEICATVTLLDGLVLARSAFHHSMNYRSAVVIGEAELVDDPSEKAAALDLFAERLVPGRQAELRPTTDKESRGTAVLRLALDKSSAKVRSGPPVDDEEDYEYDVWAGVLPMLTVLGEPIPDPRLNDGLSLPESIVVLYRQ